MFRKPRENEILSASAQSQPLTGRAPTPPNGARSGPTPSITMTTRKSSAKPVMLQPNYKINGPDLGRQGTKKVAYSKANGKPNGSILNFFKKVESPNKDDSTLFLSEGSSIVQLHDPRSIRSISPDTSDSIGEDDLLDGADGLEVRYNESRSSVKKRRLSNVVGSPQDDIWPINGDGPATIDDPRSVISGEGLEPTSNSGGLQTPPPPDHTFAGKPKLRRIGPFLDYSESEDEEGELVNTEIASQDSGLQQPTAAGAEEREFKKVRAETNDVVEDMLAERNIIIPETSVVSEVRSIFPVINGGISLPTSGVIVTETDEATWPANSPTIAPFQNENIAHDDFGGFEDLEDFPEDDEFADGEEFVERRWMEEQARLEAAEQGVYAEYPGDGFDATGIQQDVTKEETVPSCPICQGILSSLSSEQVLRHVNACLDGNPIPIPTTAKLEPTKTNMMPAGAGSRFSRAAIARPGQANPFQLGSSEAAPSSAFSKLMSSHAEDAAWASAAAAENAARGKPAYQRTCPFYKIMPGFYICVDAFRYGAVQGCNAYFLSHFHSDHYIGLTSTWSHGPIYCSTVTGNLVKQQLRVDPKWVVSLDFEAKLEVPGTQGVAVTMIPANHCPGSSLFLFEKVVGKGSNPKIQRVLHCGDFRACPAHITHPLLMPDIVDSISGKTKQQRIDVCYLDTTYLNPRYAFPSQEDVIKACADMCVSLKKERAEESDAWELVKKERAGAGMTKFVGTTMKPEDSIAMEVGSTKARGRLLVICGTYSIGKERICMGIARALDCKIWAPPGKRRICAALQDPELSSRLTDNPREAQIHMQMLMEIRAETLQDYLNSYKPHFSRIIGFRPSGWNYRPPNSRFVESPAVQTVLKSENWNSRYGMAELVPQRGSTREASCFGVPYSEHSSFRELTIFCCALRIEKIIPTVNVGSAASRAKMKAWIDRWMSERKKNGVIRLGDGEGEVRW